MNDQVFSFVLALHALSGGIALVVAPLALVVRKGAIWHRIWGKTFFYAMAVVCVTAIATGLQRPNILMALVAVFSFHMAVSGYRALYQKRFHRGERPGGLDLLIQGLAGLVNATLFIWGFSHLLLGHRDGASIIFCAFGAVGLFMVFLQVRRFYNARQDRNEWLFAHMIGFLGCYVATVSAFSAVNLAMIRPTWLQWLWPAIIGLPLITMSVRYFRNKVSEGKRSRILARARIR
ncbi:MAG: hypothetical protein H6594_07085 [Flavobacteriales bacterium]|nr:hypothetical protein [Flavobacteriales bacterium]